MTPCTTVFIPFQLPLNRQGSWYCHMKVMDEIWVAFSTLEKYFNFERSTILTGRGPNTLWIKIVDWYFDGCFLPPSWQDAPQSCACQKAWNPAKGLIWRPLLLLKTRFHKSPFLTMASSKIMQPTLQTSQLWSQPNSRITCLMCKMRANFIYCFHDLHLRGAIVSCLDNGGVMLVVEGGAPKVNQPDFRILQDSHLFRPRSFWRVPIFSFRYQPSWALIPCRRPLSYVSWPGSLSHSR